MTGYFHPVTAYKCCMYESPRIGISDELGCEYQDVTDTAKVIRKMLKTYYPKFKFKVRSERFALGSAVTIFPRSIEQIPEHTHRELQKFCSYFASGKTDVMNDSVSRDGYYLDGKVYNGALFVKYHPYVIGE